MRGEKDGRTEKSPVGSRWLRVLTKKKRENWNWHRKGFGGGALGRGRDPLKGTTTKGLEERTSGGHDRKLSYKAREVEETIRQHPEKRIVEHGKIGKAKKKPEGVHTKTA